MVKLEGGIINRTITIHLLVLICLFSSVCFANDLEEGLQAYSNKNYSKAHDLLRPLATLENLAEAQSYLGKMYQKGYGVKQDYKVAIHWYQKAADQGYTDAQYQLGLMSQNAEGIRGGYIYTMYRYREAAEQGHAKAQYNLALMYSRGWGIPIDDGKVVFWCRKAAERGLADAQNYMGTLYEIGQGVTADTKVAISWYLKAAEQGHIKAQHHLAVIYSSDWSENKDYNKAVFWCRKSAEKGLAEAQNRLGMFYNRGWGVKKDYSLALFWYQKSANQGYARAQTNIGGLYYYGGYGIKQDYKLALLWYHKAAKQGYSKAQSYLAWMYSRGIGTDADYKQAQIWSKKSKEHHLAKAKRLELEKFRERKGVFDSCSEESQEIKEEVNKIVDEHAFRLPSKMTVKEMAIWLTYTLRARKFEVAKKVIDMGANPNALVACRNDYISTTVGKYINSGTQARIPLEMLTYLVDHGYIMEIENFEDLYQGVASKGTTLEGLEEREKLKKLFEKGRERAPNFTPTLRGPLSFMAWLIREGIADPNKLKGGGSYGWPSHSISYAIAKRNNNLAKFLINNGASVIGEGEIPCPDQGRGDECVGKEGLFTPLYHAASYRNTEIVRLLLEKGKGVYSQRQLDKALETTGVDPSRVKDLLLQAGAKLSKENVCDAQACFSGWPGEGIPRLSYRNKTLVVYEYASKFSKKEVWEVDTAKVFESSKSRVHTIQFGKKEALEDFNFECGEVKVGEVINILRYEAEGYYTVRYKQTYCSSYLDFERKTKQISDMITEWWVQIQNDVTGQKGWVKATEDNFYFHDRSF